jgi:hypothetical protein
VCHYFDACDRFDAVARVLCARCCRDLMNAVAGDMSDAVDFYNSVTGAWTTAQLSVGREYLAAASAGNMAVFAGGLRCELWQEAQAFVSCLLFLDVFLLDAWGFGV